MVDAPDVFLADWIAAEKSRLDNFAEWWEEENSGQEGEMFPMSMPWGEWDEQYRSWAGA